MPWAKKRSGHVRLTGKQAGDRKLSIPPVVAKARGAKEGPFNLPNLITIFPLLSLLVTSIDKRDARVTVARYIGA